MAPWWIAAAVAVALLVTALLARPQHRATRHAPPQRAVVLSGFLHRVDTQPDTIARVVFDPNDNGVTARLRDGTVLSTFYPSAGSESRLERSLAHGGVAYTSRSRTPPSTTSSSGSSWVSLLAWLIPLLLFGALMLLLVRGMRGAGSQLMQFGRSRARRVQPDRPQVLFRDVAGAEEAVVELQEIKEYLEDPARFQALGAQIPKGVLLVGPPGTGKTLLARAVAGEARVPFFSISGSDFVEMFVGVGASRVRDLFDQAKAHAPAIVFMDELDAVGRHRGAGLGGGHDEREQTLNQLLVEMDGFDPRDNVVLIAATNRPDVLDPALLRPGRFDRQVVVDRPDRHGRAEILAVHVRGKPLAEGIDLDALAAATPGFTGAEIANAVNEAALLAARRRRRAIGQTEFEEAILRIVAGPEKTRRAASTRERSITAHHEMGHALVAHHLPNCDPVHKISIVSRGRAMGFTVALPHEDRFLTTMSTFSDHLAMTLGGRAAEDLVFDELTDGAADDLERATKLAEEMVMRFGMSRRVGPRAVGRDERTPFLGRELGGLTSDGHSEALAREVDQEIDRLLGEAQERATAVLRDHEDELHRLAELLLKHETIGRDAFERLIAGEDESAVFDRDDAAPERRPSERRATVQAR
jgi:cell division protease FtsH